MLEKNKDYVEFTLQCTSVERTRDKDYREVCFNGYSDYDFPGVPMDVVCKDFGHKVVMISKSDFERLQTENEKLKKKLHEFDPIPDYKEMLEKLYSKEDVEKFEWTLNHICGGQTSANGWMVTAKLWRRNYESLSKLVGFSSTEEIQDYLTNEAECDTLYGAISKLHDEVKCISDKWASANSSNNSWKAAAECNSPKELIEKLNLLRDDISGRSTVTEHYKRDIEKWQKATGCLRPEDISTASLVTKAMQLDQEVKILNGALQEWKEGTGCPSPSSAKTMIESGASWHHAYNEIKEKNRKLEEEINELRADYSHLLCTTGFESEGEIEDALDKCDHSTLRKALVDYEFDYETLLKLTGYKSEQDIHVALNYSEQFVYETMRELINSLKRKAKFTESGWKEATACASPEEAKTLIAECEVSWRHAYNEIKKANEKLGEEVAAWKDRTGCKYPGEAGELLEKWKLMTKCETPEAAATWITSYESACERGNRLAEMVEKLKEEVVSWKNVTGYSIPEDYMHARISGAFHTPFDYTAAWQNATGCDTPEAAETTIRNLRGRIDKMKDFAAIASNWTDRIVED